MSINGNGNRNYQTNNQKNGFEKSHQSTQYEYAHKVVCGKIYMADFDPRPSDVTKEEFSGKHYVMVLRKTVDNKACIVIPLTSRNVNREGDDNKVKIMPNKMPEKLQKNDTYAVVDQARTISIKRLYRCYDNAQQRYVYPTVPQGEIDRVMKVYNEYTMESMSEQAQLKYHVEQIKKLLEKQGVDIDKALYVETGKEGTLEGRVKTSIKTTIEEMEKSPNQTRSQKQYQNPKSKGR